MNNHFYKDNLKDEIISLLEDNDKKESDIKFIKINDKYYKWEDSKNIFNFYYASGFGIECVNEDLKIYGDNWWLERHTYDGSEWFEFKKYTVLDNIKFDNLCIKDLVNSSYELFSNYKDAYTYINPYINSFNSAAGITNVPASRCDHCYVCLNFDQVKKEFEDDTKTEEVDSI